ncbi:Mitochondrial import inner membrane translocase subunit TIM54 [Trametes pubescens]|uniref:Mitochondrial import inner membrane translocase subunit TIM54 n=1 Tax=Trametes pubescens TaxID=154538 RepID=A0A1M2VM38_TRAPU|nr:Mitochondrial import inner membrane translocase subunit TIM54 [Trametes pubescens]
MSSNGSESTLAAPQPPKSGVRTVLQYTGIPPSWLDKRPRLPSRNWLIFLSVTSTVAGYYIYDRQQCKKIRQEYVEKVKDLAEQPMGSMELPRLVTVYGAKWVGDQEYDRSMRYFRKYVKPILVAAAIDYDMVKGRRHGDIARHVEDKVRKERRIMAGLEQFTTGPLPLPGSTFEEKRQRELDGGIVIVGRHTLKEFMAGLKRGWSDGLQPVDREELLARALESDGKFDEPETELAAETTVGDGEPIPTPSRIPSSAFSVLSNPALRAPPPKAAQSIPDHLNAPPAEIPPQPPMLLTPFTNYIGLTQIPLMIWDFFNERYKVAEGAEAAYKLIRGNSRPFTAPPADAFVVQAGDVDTPEPSKPYQAELSPTDLDFDRESESYYKKNVVRDFLSEIESARNAYYKSLVTKLEIARALSRGTREPTKEEKENPPPTEVELRAERLKKELRWTADEEGWDIVRPDKDVQWDERFRNKLRVYIDPFVEEDAGSKSTAS